MTTRFPLDPPRDCPRCPRLVAFREAARAAEPTWHNAPVASFGPAGARLLIVGLAPGLRGANRTGRPFTGDYAGDLLYETLVDFGFARGTYRADPADGLELLDAAITNAVRCVPPENKPTGPEIAACRPFFEATLAAREGTRALVALGRIAHDQVLRTLALPVTRFPFGHGAVHDLAPARAFRLYDSYHCSRYNTNTGRLTREMFRAVFARIADDLAAA
ncbi:uracil-DNA glycosylase [Oharaeibacter diazotrophicus]|uniref:Type-5 uracil-DNA glycosylase n=2 Tax=Oharaeibacter diazotrophicus TaxID=1920512 RepID=A0A4R6RJ78_9HYPH|nr:uracil-DNA glycosylase [Oharaeibacter diazotrophicus]TDP86609.1 uracil-DNA glycosylase family 4 [Oharaeibacter diazotrophicus]GLS78210.1 uracil-DNA glycosylase [Oharaeibacter diazotrophicus]